jgi:hypothetical protein
MPQVLWDLGGYALSPGGGREGGREGIDDQISLPPIEACYVLPLYSDTFSLHAELKFVA